MAFASTINGASALRGAMGMPTKLRSCTTTRRQRHCQEDLSRCIPAKFAARSYRSTWAESESSGYGFARTCDANSRYRERETRNYSGYSLKIGRGAYSKWNVHSFVMAGTTRLELATSAMTAMLFGVLQQLARHAGTAKRRATGSPVIPQSAASREHGMPRHCRMRAV